MANNGDSEFADAVIKHGPPTSTLVGYYLKPEHKAGFQNAEWACKHLIEKLGTPNIRFALFRVNGRLMGVCAECRPKIQDADLIVGE